jgi:hypothetical protein
VLRAVLRTPEEAGSRACERLRRAGRTPAQLYSIFEEPKQQPPPPPPPPPKQSGAGRHGNGSGGRRAAARPRRQLPALPLALGASEAAAAVRRFGRNGVQARPFRLELYDRAAGDPWRAAEREAEGERLRRERARRAGSQAAADAAAYQAAADPASSPASSSSPSSPPRLIGAVRVLPQLVHVDPVSLELENLGLLYCPRHRARVDVSVPVELWNADSSPGVRRGGWMQVVRRAVPLSVRGSHIPPRIELDVGEMKAWDALRLADVPLGALRREEEGEAGGGGGGGRRAAAVRLRARDPSQPVVRCTLRGGGE